MRAFLLLFCIAGALHAELAPVGTLARTLAERSDPDLIFSAEIPIRPEL